MLANGPGARTTAPSDKKFSLDPDAGMCGHLVHWGAVMFGTIDPEPSHGNVPAADVVEGITVVFVGLLGDRAASSTVRTLQRSK